MKSEACHPETPFYCRPQRIAPIELCLDNRHERTAAALVINLCEKRGGWSAITLEELVNEIHQQRATWKHIREVILAASLRESRHIHKLVRWKLRRLLTIDGLLDEGFHPRPRLLTELESATLDLSCIPIDTIIGLSLALVRLDQAGYLTVDHVSVSSFTITPLPAICLLLATAANLQS